MENDKLVRASDIFPALQSAGVPYNYATQRVIEQLPAVDAVEVRHAYWQGIAGKSARVCSRCEKDEPYKFADEDADVFEYCPHCGARMDGRGR
jgi:hypothetical protein